jgi:hypothetical protein
MRFTPKEEYFKNTDAKGNETKVLMMSTDANNTPKLAKLFDCILNTPEYFKYVTNLYWVYENDPKTIARVDVKLSNKEVATNNQHVWWYRKGTRAENKNAKPESEQLLVENLSEDAKRSLGKRYKSDGGKNFKALVQELQDPQNLTSYTPTDCASVGNSDDSSNSSSVAGPFNTKTWDVDTFVRNLHYWQDRICENNGNGGSKTRKPAKSWNLPNSYGRTKNGCSWCTSVINRALRDTGFGQKYWGGEPWDVYSKMKASNSDFVEAASGQCSNKVDDFNFGSATISKGDVCVMWTLLPNPKKLHRHTCAFDGSHWISDFVQQRCNVYRSASECRLEYHLFKHK